VAAPPLDLPCDGPVAYTGDIKTLIKSSKGRDGRTNFILRIKEQETHLILHEHDDDDDDNEHKYTIDVCPYPSFLSALQPWVGLGFLNNQTSLLSVFRLLYSLYLRYFQVCYNVIHPSISEEVFLSSHPINSLPSIIFLGIAATSILFTCPSHLIL
jgi:hypothetical protein